MLKAQTIAVGNERFQIRDDGVPSVFADLIVESRLMGDIVCISLGTIVADGDVEAGNKPEAVIAARLRMPIPAARVVCAQLSLLIDQAEQQLVAKKSAEPAVALN